MERRRPYANFLVPASSHTWRRFARWAILGIRVWFSSWITEHYSHNYPRKKEQGQNAKEIVEFDPLIEKAEKDIAELRKKLK